MTRDEIEREIRIWAGTPDDVGTVSRNRITALYRLALKAIDTDADARLGKAVREAIVTGGVGADEPGEIEGYAGSLREDKSFWAASILDAIAAALREEEKR